MIAKDSHPPHLHTRILWGVDGTREALEHALTSQRIPLSVESTCAWARCFRRRTALVVVSTQDGEPIWGFGLESTGSRSLPGYVILRVPRFRADAPTGALRAGLEALIRLSRESRVLRVDLEVYCPKSNFPANVPSILIDSGFRVSTTQRTYLHTVMVDLTPSEEEILASFHKTGRQNIRAARKYPVVVRPITDSALEPRMNELAAESFQRTKGRFRYEDWGAWTNLASDSPHLARVVGMFEVSDCGEEQLIAFALAVVNGDVAEYRTAASTRHTTLKVPQLYAPSWELILWAKEQGAEIFDWGGVSLGSSAQDHARRGINKFKYYFSKQVVDVGLEYSFEPSRFRSAAAKALRTAGTVLGFGGE